MSTGLRASLRPCVRVSVVPLVVLPPRDQFVLVVVLDVSVKVSEYEWLEVEDAPLISVVALPAPEVELRALPALSELPVKFPTTSRSLVPLCEVEVLPEELSEEVVL